MANQIDNDAKVFGERGSGYSSPGVIRTSSGRIYVGHYNLSGELEIHYSDNNGDTWTLDVTFTETDIDYLSFAVSSTDDVFVSYCQGNESPVNIIIKKRDSSTGTWSEILDEEVSSGPQQPILLYNNTNNRLYIFWCISGVSINSRYSDDNGSTWNAVNSANSSIYHVLYSGDIRASDDMIILSFADSNLRSRVYLFNLSGTLAPAPYSLHYDTVYDSAAGGNKTVSLSDGTVFTAAIRDDNDMYVYFGSTRQDDVGAIPNVKLGNLSVGVDNSDNIYVFYTKTDNKCYYIKYDAGTSSWVSEVELTTGDGLRPACEQHSIMGSSSLHITYFSD